MRRRIAVGFIIIAASACFAAAQPAPAWSTKRSVVDDPSKGPARLVGRLHCQQAAAPPEMATAFLVGPKHVVTAAHVVWRKDLKGKNNAGETGFWDQMFFYPGSFGLGMDKKAQPFGALQGRRHLHAQALSGCQ